MRSRRAIALCAALCAGGCLSSPERADGEGGEDGGPAVSCGEALMADGFAGPALTARWDPTKSNDPGTISVDGQLHFDVVPTDAYLYTAIFSREVFAAGEVTLDADTAVSIGGDGDAFVGWWDQETDGYIGIFQEVYGGSGRRIGVRRGTLAVPDSATDACNPCGAYDPELERFWRVRGLDGTLHFETSPDGADWTALAPPQPLELSSPRVIVWAECAVGNQVNLTIDDIAVRACADAAARRHQ